MKGEIVKLQELVKKAKELLNQKNNVFIYSVYIKVDFALFLSFNLHNFKDDQIMCQYSYNLATVEKMGIDNIVDEVIDKSKKVVLNNLKSIDTWNNETERMVLILDIMGFKNMISNLSYEEIYLKLYKLFTSFRKLNDLQQKYCEDMFWVELFSDTIFIISSDCRDITIAMFEMFVSEILSTALTLGIVFKGAFAEGKVIVDKENHICFGQPIIDAYLLEENQEWFGIACHESVKSIKEDKINEIEIVDGEQKIVKIKPIFVNYNIPLKHGMGNHLSFAWFNHAVVSYDEVKKNLQLLRETSPSHVKSYYDRVFEFMNFCEKKGDECMKQLD